MKGLLFKLSAWWWFTFLCGVLSAGVLALPLFAEEVPNGRATARLIILLCLLVWGVVWAVVFTRADVWKAKLDG